MSRGATASRSGGNPPPGPGRNSERGDHGQRRANATHASATDPDARLYKQPDGLPSRRSYVEHVRMAAAVAAIGPKNPPQVERTAVEAALTPSTGTAERGVTLVMLDRRKGGKPITLGARQGLC